MSEETFILVLQILQFVVSLGLIAVCIKLIQQNRQFAKERQQQKPWNYGKETTSSEIPTDVSDLFQSKRGWVRKHKFGSASVYTGRPVTPDSSITPHQSDDLIELLQAATRAATEQPNEEIDELGNLISPADVPVSDLEVISSKQCSTYELLKPGDIVALQINLTLCGRGPMWVPVVKLTVGKWWQTIELAYVSTHTDVVVAGKLKYHVEQSDSDKNTFYFTVPFWVDATTVDYYQGYVNHVGLTKMQFDALLSSLVPEIVLAIIEFKKQTGAMQC